MSAPPILEGPLMLLASHGLDKPVGVDVDFATWLANDWVMLPSAPHSVRVADIAGEPRELFAAPDGRLWLRFVAVRPELLPPVPVALVATVEDVDGRPVLARVVMFDARGCRYSQNVACREYVAGRWRPLPAGGDPRYEASTLRGGV